MIAECKVLSDEGQNQSIEIASSSSINVANTIPQLFENVRIQATFGHLDHITGTEKAWTKFYKDTDEVREDISKEFEVKILRYIFAYPEEKGMFRYKRINVGGKAYIQKFKRRNGRYVFDTRFAVKGKARETRRKLQLAEEL